MDNTIPPIPADFNLLTLHTRYNQAIAVIVLAINAMQEGIHLRDMEPEELMALDALTPPEAANAKAALAEALQYWRDNGHLLTSGKAVIV